MMPAWIEALKAKMLALSIWTSRSTTRYTLFGPDPSEEDAYENNSAIQTWKGTGSNEV
jgi:hypothetical protein